MEAKPLWAQTRSHSEDSAGQDAVVLKYLAWNKKNRASSWNRAREGSSVARTWRLMGPNQVQGLHCTSGGRELWSEGGRCLSGY